MNSNNMLDLLLKQMFKINSCFQYNSIVERNIKLFINLNKNMLQVETNLDKKKNVNI